MNLGFIVEGFTEYEIVNSDKFKQFIQDCGHELVEPIINAEGGGNLLPRYINDFIRRINSGNIKADKIIVITDLENEDSVEVVKDRIHVNSIDRDCIFVPVKAIESWFIAHLDVIRKTTDKKFPDVNDPENKEILPWDRIKKICVDNKIRGPGFSKLAFSKRMIRNGF